MADGERTRLVVVAGLDRAATETVCDRLMHAEPGVVVVHHDLRALAEGVVRRRVRSTSSGTKETAELTEVLELAHGCVSCTLREDVLPLLRRVAAQPDVRRIVLHLDPGMEPESVCWTLASVVVGDETAGEVTVTDLVDIGAVLAVVDESTWLSDATGDDYLTELSDRGLGATPDEDRTLAQVAVGQVAFADAVVVAGRAADGWTAARVGAVLDRLAPGAPRARLDTADLPALVAAIPPSARRGAVDDAHAPLLRGTPPLEPDCGVALTLFTERRPFHPQRLHEAIDVLLDGVVHTKGRAWVASQPDVALWLESAGGGLRVGHAGAWLATADDNTWDRVDAPAADEGGTGLAPGLRRPDPGTGDPLPPGSARGDRRCPARGTAHRRRTGRRRGRLAPLPRPVRVLAHRPVRRPRHRERHDPRQPKGQCMKPSIHPDYGPVVFRDSSTGTQFLTRSTATSQATTQWADGNTYPLIVVDVTADSHPFWTGTGRVFDTTGQVEKFHRRYGQRRGHGGGR